MRTFAVLFSLMLLFAAGCGESATAVKKAPKMQKVDAATLETVAAESSLTLVDFSAVW